jgi:hypothetical protein
LGETRDLLILHSETVVIFNATSPLAKFQASFSDKEHLDAMEKVLFFKPSRISLPKLVSKRPKRDYINKVMKKSVLQIYLEVFSRLLMNAKNKYFQKPLLKNILE